MPSSDAEEMGAVFFDLEGDADLDLYVVTGGVESDPGDAILADRLFINQGDGRFLPASAGSLPAIAESGTSVCCRRFRPRRRPRFVCRRRKHSRRLSSSGKKLFARSINPASLLSNQRAASEVSQLGIVDRALWSDVDNDGWIDLLVAQEWGAVKVFKNVHGDVARPYGGKRDRKPAWLVERDRGPRYR